MGKKYYEARNEVYKVLVNDDYSKIRGDNDLYKNSWKLDKKQNSRCSYKYWKSNSNYWDEAARNQNLHAGAGYKSFDQYDKKATLNSKGINREIYVNDNPTLNKLNKYTTGNYATTSKGNLPFGTKVRVFITRKRK